MTKTKWAPAEWQKNPDNITTSTVQFWSIGGTMITDQMKLSDARQMVKEGRAFVITGQAINQI